MYPICCACLQSVRQELGDRLYREEYEQFESLFRLKEICLLRFLCFNFFLRVPPLYDQVVQSFATHQEACKAEEFRIVLRLALDAFASGNAVNHPNQKTNFFNEDLPFHYPPYAHRDRYKSMADLVSDMVIRWNTGLFWGRHALSSLMATPV